MARFNVSSDRNDFDNILRREPLKVVILNDNWCMRRMKTKVSYHGNDFLLLLTLFSCWKEKKILQNSIKRKIFARKKEKQTDKLRGIKINCDEWLREVFQEFQINKKLFLSFKWEKWRIQFNINSILR